MKARELLAEFRKDPEFAKAYEELAPEFEIARQIIRLRAELGMTQMELAEKIGTRQSNISRLENGVGHPSVSLLKRVANALGAKLRIRFESGLPAKESLASSGQPCVGMRPHEEGQGGS